MCIKLLIKMSLRRVAGGILEILLVTFHENRLRIYRLIGEKHALHVRAAIFFSYVILLDVVFGSVYSEHQHQNNIKWILAAFVV